MKKPTIRNLKKHAWRVWSKHIRYRNADSKGYTECYTCRQRFPASEMHAGHWKHRRLDFDYFNIHPQCAKCNLYGHGKLDLYTQRLVEDHGIAKVKEKAREAEIIHKYTREELEEIIEKYK